MELGSKEVAACALKMAISRDMEEEKAVKEACAALSVRASAVNFGGEFLTSVNKMIERAIVSARREGLIGETHSEEGAVAGAAMEAISQIMQKGIGLNVGGKIGIARAGDHLSVALFFGVGLLHLNEVAVGLGHRVI